MKNKILNTLIIGGLLLGILVGFLFPSFMKEISFLGTIYINLLKFLIVPIIFTSIMVTVYKSRRNNGRILGKSIITFIIMFVITFLLTSVIVWILKPGVDFNFKEVSWIGEIKDLNISDILVSLFPTNIMQMILDNSIFACILVAFISGLMAAKVDNGDKVIDVVDGFKNIFNEILKCIMYITPIGVFSLIGTTIVDYGSAILGAGAMYIGIAYLCSVVTMIVVMILPVWIYAKINPITYVRKIAKVWLMTFTTCSSAATLPYTIKVCNEDLNIPSRITNITVPLGCTIHMCGGAVSFALLGIFNSQLFGIDISLTTYLIMLLSATLINMAAPGIPGGGIVIGATYLSLLNMPLTFIGFYGGIYRLLDMSYTTLNVTGDITANVLIAKKEKAL